jgi:NADH-quinone oxidoreductase subunit G
MNKINPPTLTIDGKPVLIEGERNLLELIRKANIDLPTFCYHSDLSVYGACRLCIVQVEGRGIVGACSTPPEPGLNVQTSTQEIREIRKITVELLLANHVQGCLTCSKSMNCQLQSLAQRLGIDNVRFKPVHNAGADRRIVAFAGARPEQVRAVRRLRAHVLGDPRHRRDRLFASRQPGDGAAGFRKEPGRRRVRELRTVRERLSHRRADSESRSGAGVEAAWRQDEDGRRADRSRGARGLGECFGLAPGALTTGQIVAALRQIGFDQIYDTSYSADLTVIEEATEFLERKTKGEKLPQFTSCCPGWVKYAEQYFPELLPNLSSCKSPQQMLGALLKSWLPEQMNIKRDDLKVVAIMPCTAKKFEARRPEMARERAIPTWTTC